MKKIITFIALSVYASVAHAGDPYKTWPEEVAASEKFKSALRKNDRQAVAGMIQYPLDRKKPLLTIRDEKEFLANWEDYFDETNIAEVLADKPEDFGWRGMALGGGNVWFNGDKINAINLQTEHYQQTLKTAIKEDNEKLNPLAKNYTALAFACDTAHMHIRVQEHGKGDLRLFGWSRKGALRDTPLFTLKSGSWEPQGNGGNAIYVFNSDALKYEVQETHLCGEDCNHYLVTSRKGEQISREQCNETNQ